MQSGEAQNKFALSIIALCGLTPLQHYECLSRLLSNFARKKLIEFATDATSAERNESHSHYRKIERFFTLTPNHITASNFGKPIKSDRCPSKQQGGLFW